MSPEFMRKLAARLAERYVAQMDDPSRVLNAAVNAARCDETDEVALASLRDEIAGVAETAVRTVIADGEARHMRLNRSGQPDYLHDRAYRLLLALRDDTPVAPIASEDRDLFAEEVRLGRMPIPEAFAELAKREPRLSELESDMSRRRRANRALKLVGPDAATPDALLTTTTAGDIAGAYLWKAADERGHITSALFDGRSFESHGQFGFG